MLKVQRFIDNQNHEETIMQAIELETAIVKGELHAKLPQDIDIKKAKIIVLYEAPPPAPSNERVGLVELLDELTEQPNWPRRSKAEIDLALEEERLSWD
jgi:hypothetical protein